MMVFGGNAFGGESQVLKTLSQGSKVSLEKKAQKAHLRILEFSASSTEINKFLLFIWTPVYGILL